MSKINLKTKKKTLTSHFAHLQDSNTLNLNTISNFHCQTKKQSQQTQPEYSREFVENLIGRLSSLEQKQRKTQLIFQDCLKSLKNQIQIKDKTNKALKDQIWYLKQQVQLFKIQFSKIARNRSKSMKSSKSSKSNLKEDSEKQTKEQNDQKQNLNPYLITSLNVGKNRMKVYEASKFKQQTKLSKVTFKLNDFVVDKKLSNIQNQDYNSIEMRQITNKYYLSHQEVRMQRSGSRSTSLSQNRYKKSKSIGSFIKSRLFAK